MRDFLIQSLSRWALGVITKGPRLLRRWHARLPSDHRQAVSWIGGGTLLLLLWGVVETTLGPRASTWLVRDDHVHALVHAHRWIAYDPLGYDPTTGAWPDLESLEREIGWIRGAGFDGILTFTSREPLDQIPRIAKKQGLAVILGVWDPADRRELHLARRAAPWVDGYALGHNGLSDRYTWGELRQAVERLRFRTRRPVSTTERLSFYLENDRLAKLGDWLFPDVHLSLGDPESDQPPTFSVDVARDVELTIGHARRVAEVARRLRKPVLLKMVTYPHAGASGASLEQHDRFFSMLLEGRREVDPRLPHDVAISVHGAFDTPWKARWPFFPWEAFTGLLDSDGRPRPAARTLVERLR